MDLTISDALRAYARMLNTLDARHLEPLLADNFSYSSQMVFDEITSKAEYLDYIAGKLETIRRTGSLVYAEMGRISGIGGMTPCVVVAQGSEDELVAYVVGEVLDGKIARLDMCVIPPPSQAERSGEYPQ